MTLFHINYYRQLSEWGLHSFPQGINIQTLPLKHTQTHTHTHIYIYCVCVLYIKHIRLSVGVG